MFEELLKCLSEIYAGVEQKITEMNELKAENASLREEIANHVCECDHEEELAQAKAEVEAAKAAAEEARAEAEAAKAAVEEVKAEHNAQLEVLRKEFEELKDLLFPEVEEPEVPVEPETPEPEEPEEPEEPVEPEVPEVDGGENAGDNNGEDAGDNSGEDAGDNNEENTEEDAGEVEVPAE